MTETAQNMTYAAAGVNYDPVDRFKRDAQKAAQMTGAELAQHFAGHGFSDVAMSRGESVHLIETPWAYLAHLTEGLGTKNLVADEIYRHRGNTGHSYYDNLAQDTVAMILNDLATLGAAPLDVAMHVAAEDGQWFADENRAFDLLQGWKRACQLARCSWGGGETPVLKGIIQPTTALLSGSAIGIISPKERLINPSRIKDGDAIVIIPSSGIHANGLTLARKIAEKLPHGYFTRLPGRGARMYGETLLDPTFIYTPIIERCLDVGVDIHYSVNITGHGWRKFMRAPQPFTYIIETLPPQHAIFDFIQSNGPVDDREMYGTFNMGAGFALYLPEDEVPIVLDIGKEIASHTSETGGAGIFRAGHIEASDSRRVAIPPKGLIFHEESLAVR